ncbi:hypothetical protein BHE74_00043211 [Ensete ventricosum]|nr:hypothetical protein BHE74_00043211 [Ensete ventricosum]
MMHCFPIGFFLTAKSWFPILQPDPDHIRLRLAREGLEAIQDITTPVAAVAVSLAFGLFYTSVYIKRKYKYFSYP